MRKGEYSEKYELENLLHSHPKNNNLGYKFVAVQRSFAIVSIAITAVAVAHNSITLAVVFIDSCDVLGSLISYF